MKMASQDKQRASKNSLEAEFPTRSSPPNLPTTNERGLIESLNSTRDQGEKVTGRFTVFNVDPRFHRHIPDIPEQDAPVAEEVPARQSSSDTQPESTSNMATASAGPSGQNESDETHDDEFMNQLQRVLQSAEFHRLYADIKNEKAQPYKTTSNKNIQVNTADEILIELDRTHNDPKIHCIYLDAEQCSSHSVQEVAMAEVPAEMISNARVESEINIYLIVLKTLLVSIFLIVGIFYALKQLVEHLMTDEPTLLIHLFELGMDFWEP